MFIPNKMKRRYCRTLYSFVCVTANWTQRIRQNIFATTWESGRNLLLELIWFIQHSSSLQTKYHTVFLFRIFSSSLISPCQRLLCKKSIKSSVAPAVWHTISWNKTKRTSNVTLLKFPQPFPATEFCGRVDSYSKLIFNDTPLNVRQNSVL